MLTYQQWLEEKQRVDSYESQYWYSVYEDFYIDMNIDGSFDYY